MLELIINIVFDCIIVRPVRELCIHLHSVPVRVREAGSDRNRIAKFTGILVNVECLNINTRAGIDQINDTLPSPGPIV